MRLDIAVKTATVLHAKPLRYERTVSRSCREQCGWVYHRRSVVGAQPLPTSSFLMNLLLVIIGGGVGSGLRYWLSGVLDQRCGESFPLGTLAVNVLGCFAIGLFGTLMGTEGRWLVSPAVRSFFMIGVCGGFTTFSSFSLQTLELARDAEWLYAGLNILGSVALCLVFVWLGHVLAATLNR